jgi:hypothetical protein
MVAAGSKNGNLYVMRESDLESSGTPIQTLQLNAAGDGPGTGGVDGVPAYWPAGRMLFVSDAGPGAGGVSAGLVGLSIQSDCTLKVAWSRQLGGLESPNSTPTVADGVVFLGLGTGSVQAFDAAAGTPLWNSGALGAAVYEAPIVARGRVYAGSWNGFAAASAGTLRAFSIGGTPPPPPPGPAFVQQVSAHRPATAGVTVAPAANVTSGDRLIVEVGVWSGAGATAASVTDSAGNHYVELLHFKASEATEMSVWTAPVTVGGGTRPTITVKPTSSADLGVGVLEYAGLSTVGDATVVDQTAHATGLTGAAGSVASGATAATTAGNELAVGLYVDSGFGDSLAADPAYTQRINVSPTAEMEFVAEDRVVSAAATPDATVFTSPLTTWLMATVVFKAGP